MEKKTAIIIGAGPAGLTAAYELLTKTDIKPLVFEATLDIGGISKTVNYKGNRIDIGGHRFFSKSQVVMDWWKNFFPYEDRTRPERDPDRVDLLMLIRTRLSRIMFLHKLFDYPVTLSYKTLKNLGVFRIIHIGSSYIKTIFFKRKPEISLEDFFINRFGVSLYKTFFKSYT
jgi:protoporphyrinogen oxidase